MLSPLTPSPSTHRSTNISTATRNYIFGIPSAATNTSIPTTSHMFPKTKQKIDPQLHFFRNEKEREEYETKRNQEREEEEKGIKVTKEEEQPATMAMEGTATSIDPSLLPIELSESSSSAFNFYSPNTIMRWYRPEKRLERHEIIIETNEQEKEEETEERIGTVVEATEKPIQTHQQA